MDRRSPLESIFNVIGGLPRGHDKPLKQALYNAVALFLLFLCCAATFGLYVILEPFVKPLMWAVLVGSALHPLKRSLRDKFQRWFINLEETNTPAVVGLLLLPINIFNELSECIGRFVYNRLKVICVIFATLAIIIVLYKFTPRILLALLWKSGHKLYQTLNFFINTASFILVLIAILGYVSLVYFLWNPENNVKFHYAAMVIWFFAICNFAGIFGILQMPIFILSILIFLGGFISEVYEVYTYANASGHPISLSNLFLRVFHNKPIQLNISEEEMTETNAEKKQEQKADVVETQTTQEANQGSAQVKSMGEKKNNGSVLENEDPWSLELFDDKSVKKETKAGSLSKPGVLITDQGIHLVHSTKKQKPLFQRSISQPYFHSKLYRSKIPGLRKDARSVSSDSEQPYESTFYLYSVFWACVLMFFWKNQMLLPLLPLPIFCYVIKHIGSYLGIWTYISSKYDTLSNTVIVWCRDRHDALVPVPIRGIYRVSDKVNNTIKTSIKNSIDTVASCVVIVGIIVFVLCASVFILIQIYAETIMLAQLLGNTINQTVVHNPELRQLLPPSWDDTLDSVLDNAYQYGREGISKTIKSITNDEHSKKSAKLEQQVLELWDRIYQSWMSSDDNNGPKVTDEAVSNSWEAFVANVQKSPEVFNINGILEFGKQNVGTLLSVLETLWGLFINNISLIVGSLSTCISILLGGGTAVLNFILNMVVFLTTLFYLLNSSEEIYKPVELMTKFSSSGKRFGHALEAAVNSVFSASFKMATFYGMWTWFIHNLFGVKIVYLPSAFGTLLGAIPFLGTYWACVPAVLDLWLAQDRWISAIIFAGFQFLPTSMVDTSIYSEIKGGHPYLTGLAIAGGIFCLGVEGAIIGPLLLCGLYVAIDLSSSFFKESPVEEALSVTD